MCPEGKGNELTIGTWNHDPEDICSETFKVLNYRVIMVLADDDFGGVDPAARNHL